jgi:hypothetical protein
MESIAGEVRKEDCILLKTNLSKPIIGEEE